MKKRPKKKLEIYKVVICGDRDYRRSYAKEVRQLIAKLVQEHGTRKLVVITGGAPGVDTLAKMAAQKVNVHAAEVEALWDTRRKGAGPQRNEIMAALEPHEVVGIHDNISESKGTADMLDWAEQLGIPNRLIEP